MHEAISGGYRIVKPAARKPWMSAALVPAHVVSASGSIVASAPDTWALAWTGDSMSDRLKAAAAFGLDEAGLETLTSFSTRAFEEGVLGYPGVFFEVEGAHEVLRLFPEVAARAVVIGLALSREMVAAFLEENPMEEGLGEHGVVAAIRRGGLAAPGGECLGYDVLGWDHGSFHSYLCNGLDVVFDEELGLRPNRHGLFDDLDAARRCADFAGQPSTGAEDGLWLPWRITRYGRQDEGGTSPGEPDRAGSGPPQYGVGDVPSADPIAAVDRLPMEVGEDTIRRWLAAIIRHEDRPSERVEALIALQDRLALHRSPALFVASDREKIEAWLSRIWDMDHVAFVDAAATLILSQGLDRGLLQRTLRRGNPESAKIAKGALDEP